MPNDEIVNGSDYQSRIGNNFSIYDLRGREGSTLQTSVLHMSDNPDIHLGYRQNSDLERCFHPLGPIVYRKSYRKYSSMAFDSDLFDERYLTKIRVPEIFELSCHISRLLIGLFCWISSDRSREPQARDIFFRCFMEGPDYAKYLKDFRHYSIRKTLSGIGLESVPEKYKDAKSVRSYSDIFSERYLIHWVEEDPRSIYEYSYLPVDKIDSDDKERFIDKLVDLLPDELLSNEYTCRLSTLLTPSLTSSVKIEGDKVIDTGPLSSLRHKYRDSSVPTYKFIGKRAVVQVGPANVRDTVVLDYRSLLAVQSLNKMLTSIVERIQFSAHIRDPVRRFRLIQSFSRNNYQFFMRDLKKEGLTKPRELIYLVGEALKEKYPSVDWNIISLYQDMTIIDGDKILSPPRGTSLGMCNEITTLIQCTLFALLQEEFSALNEDIPIDALFLNDDGVIGIQSDDDSLKLDLADLERSLLSRYRLIRNEEKSFFSDKGFIFLEEYTIYGLIDDKTLLRDCNTMMSILCQNATHAKAYLASGDSTSTAKWLPLIISHLGYELDERELYYPNDIGGWIPYRRNGLSTSLEFIFDRDLDLKFAQRLLLASKVKPDKKESGEVLSPFIFKDIDDLKEVFPRESAIKHKYVIRTRKGFSSYWNNYSKRRKDSFFFGKLYSVHTKLGLANLVCRLTDLRGYSLPTQMVESETLESYSMTLPDVSYDSSLQGYLRNLYLKGDINIDIGKRVYPISDFSYKDFISAQRCSSMIEVAGRRLTTFRYSSIDDRTPADGRFDEVILNSTRDIERFTSNPQLVLADYAYREDLIPTSIRGIDGLEPYLFHLGEKSCSMLDIYQASTLGFSVFTFLLAMKITKSNNAAQCYDTMLAYLEEHPIESKNSEDVCDSSSSDAEMYQIKEGKLFYNFVKFIEERYTGGDKLDDFFLTPELEDVCYRLRAIVSYSSSLDSYDSNYIDTVVERLRKMGSPFSDGFDSWWKEFDPRAAPIDDEEQGDCLSLMFG